LTVRGGDSGSGDASASGAGGEAGGASSGSGGATSIGGQIGSGGASSTGGAKAIGGAPGNGGATGSGGATTNGGATSSGGAADSGGATGSGGATSIGGQIGSGGASSTGGTKAIGGATGTGGLSAAGGSKASGGATVSGGSGATGGASPTGGGTGGTTATGGTIATGGTNATGGAGGGTSTLVQPIARTNGKYVLEFGDIFFEVDSLVGARVITLTLAGGPNYLTGTAQDAVNYGSTFRVSPQSAWPGTWPPPPEIDTSAYTMSVSGQTIVGTSPNAASIGATVTKKFTPGLTNQSIVAEYTIQSTASGKSVAPWEDTRVFPGGLTFYPTGDLAPTGGTFPLPATQTSFGCTWFQYPATVSASARLIADGKEGWIAHITSGGYVLVKKYPDIASTAHAPGEGEISIYVDGGGKFIEIETQGAYAALPSGQSVTWTTTWYVRKLPTGISATPNQALVDWVRGLIHQ
jgi:hypothetical protein